MTLVLLLEESVNKISLKNELIRKSIHLSSSVVPLCYYFIDKNLAIVLLSIAVLSSVAIDIIRAKHEPSREFFMKLMKPILRDHELDSSKLYFTGATYITLAFLICVIVFPKPLAITAMLIVIFCDSFAAIVGKNWGRHFISNKTIEGSLAFLITGIIIILLTPKMSDSILEYYVGFSAVFMSAVFEVIPLKIDDNISIPIFFGTVYLILLKVLL